jgi:Na+/proline symporter
LFTTQVVLWLPIVVYVPSLALHQVTGFDEMMVAGLLVAVCVFYTFLGGIKAVVWTDLFQIMSTVVVYLVIIVKGTLDAGGLGVIYQKNYDSGRLDAPK